MTPVAQYHKEPSIQLLHNGGGTGEVGGEVPVREIVEGTGQPGMGRIAAVAAAIIGPLRRCVSGRGTPPPSYSMAYSPAAAGMAAVIIPAPAADADVAIAATITAAPATSLNAPTPIHAPRSRLMIARVGVVSRCSRLCLRYTQLGREWRWLGHRGFWGLVCPQPGWKNTFCSLSFGFSVRTSAQNFLTIS